MNRADITVELWMGYPEKKTIRPDSTKLVKWHFEMVSTNRNMQRP